MTLEAAMQQSNQIFKGAYKRYRTEFYMPKGLGVESEKVFIKEEKRKKTVMMFFLVAVGDSVQIEFKVREQGCLNEYKLTLDSGDAFVID